MSYAMTAPSARHRKISETPNIDLLLDLMEGVKETFGFYEVKHYWTKFKRVLPAYRPDRILGNLRKWIRPKAARHMSEDNSAPRPSLKDPIFRYVRRISENIRSEFRISIKNSMKPQKVLVNESGEIVDIIGSYKQMPENLKRKPFVQEIIDAWHQPLPEFESNTMANDEVILPYFLPKNYAPQTEPSHIPDILMNMNHSGLNAPTDLYDNLNPFPAMGGKRRKAYPLKGALQAA